MKKMIKITFNLLNEKVKENLYQIRKNQKTIQKMLKKNDCGSGNEELEKNYSKNKSLLAENIDFIYLQLNLANSLEKKSELDQSSYSEPILRKVNECFELTMDGILIYNSIQNSDSEKVIHQLSNYHQQLENYG